MNLNAIKQMERIARSDTSIISLGQGIPSIPVDTRIREAIIQAIQDGTADAYSDPQGLPELRQLIAGQLADRSMTYDASEIVVTAGAIEALSVTLRAVTDDHRREIIVPTPVYSAYFKVIESARATAKQIPLSEATGWQLDVQKIIDNTTPQTAAILLCNPNNPTGTVYRKIDLERLAEFAIAKNIALIVDEVYSNMLYDNTTFYSPAQNERFKKSVIRIMSFSKDFSLTGWRVGYVHAHVSRISKLVAIHDTLVNCAPVISQVGAIAALKHHDEIIANNTIIYNSCRNEMAEYLDMLGTRARYTMPKGAYFFFPKIKTSGVASTAADLAQKAGVVVVPGASFGAGGEDHVRLCFGRSPADIREGMKRFVNYYGEW